MLDPKITNAWATHRRVCTDTRKLMPGDLFFALKGDRFNGNLYAQAALDAGASLVVMDEAVQTPNQAEKVVVVESALLALQQLALHERKSWAFPVFSLTGTNGKTSTKELISAALSGEKKVHFTQGNLNNHIGVPLTMLSVQPGTEVTVVEMGANKPGDIKELCEIALPTHCLITNIGLAHLELMGGADGVERTKGEMFAFARKAGSRIFVNEKDARIVNQATGIENRVTCGMAHSDFHIVGINQHATGMKVVIQSRHWHAPHTFSTSLIGTHNAENVLHAVAVATELGASVEGIKKGIEGYAPRMNRTQLLQGDGFTILLDAYNANPSSMEAVIRHTFSLNYGRVALVLGDMLELGDSSEALHSQLGELISGFPVSKCIGVGLRMKQMLENCPHVPQAWYLNPEDASLHLKKELENIDFVVIKGSRGMAMEKLLDAMGVTAPNINH
jgi:UDP-N-acetylmuramoyl-tripeptide--D-alanyl-D-alanine ligase